MDVLVQTQARRFARKGTWQRVYSTGTMTTGTYRTDLNVTGQGYVLFVATTNDTTHLRITVDGGTPYVVGTAGAYTYAYVDGSSRSGKVFVYDVQFTQSLKVESYNAGSSGSTVTTEVDYILST